MVLLSNDGILPLDPEQAGRVAVIGPLGDTTFDDWYSGTPPYRRTLRDGIAERVGAGSVTFHEGVDRIEWIIMPDPATASAALQNGEVDWWENPISDLVPVLKRNRNVAVDIADPLGNIGTFRMNQHLNVSLSDQINDIELASGASRRTSSPAASTSTSLPRCS